MNKLINTDFLKRCSNFELLRLVSALDVIFLHVVGKNWVLSSRKTPQLMFLYNLAFTANSEFMLISSYFGFRGKLKFSKLIPILFVQLFYSVSVYLYLVWVGHIKFDKYYFIEHFFPLANNLHWYILAYVEVQIIFHPIANSLITKGHSYHLFYCIFAFLVALASNVDLFGHLVQTNYRGCIVFMIYLPIGMYLRIYDVKINFFISLIGLLVCNIIMFNIRNGDFKYTGIFSEIFRNCGSESVFVYMQSIFKFLLFKNITVPSCIGPVINFIAESSIGIYLIHDHPDFRSYMNNKINKHLTKSNNIVVFSLCCVASVFLICLAVDIVRRIVFDALIFQRDYYKRFCNWIDSFIKEEDDERIIQIEDENIYSDEFEEVNNIDIQQEEDH